MWDGLRLFMDHYAGTIVTSSDISRRSGEWLRSAVGRFRRPILVLTRLSVPSMPPALEGAITNKWGPQQRADGQWDNVTYGYSSWNGFAGSVSVTNGSSVVTGSGTNWQSSWFPSPAWFPEDPVAYSATYVSPTEVHLDRPYEGTTRSGSGWQFYNLVGRGTGPFSMGIVATAWHYAYLALQRAGSAKAAEARQFVLDAANWITNYGYSPTAKGLYYGRNHPNCEPISDDKPYCGASPAESARFLNSEVLNAFSAAYLLTGDSKYKTQGDKLFGAVWGKLGGPETDSIWVTTYEDGQWTLQTKEVKGLWLRLWLWLRLNMAGREVGP